MNRIRKNMEPEFEQEKELFVEQESILNEVEYFNKKPAFWVCIFSQDYSIILRYMPFIMFLFIFGLIYVYNGHYANKIFRNINQLIKECNRLEYRDKILKNEWYHQTQSSKIIEKLKPLGYKELKTPPYSFKMIYTVKPPY
ncbi:MAG: FtsL-like putative cell division protein [Chitinophagaceae bacterium]